MSSELERPLAQPAAGAYLEEARAHPGVGTYVGIGILTFVLTGLEILVVNVDALAGIMAPLILALMAANFTLAALYYQGLQHDSVVNKLTFGIGLFLGLLVAVSLEVLLQLGIIAK